MKRNLIKWTAAALCLACLTMAPGVCGRNASDKSASAESAGAGAVSAEETEKTETEPSAAPEITPEPTPEMSPQQRNALNMLNYLRFITQEIDTSVSSRLCLEERYSELLNNTHPNAVDRETLAEVNSLLDTLESFRMTAVKRERLRYAYEQSKAQALRDAVPDPGSLLLTIGSGATLLQTAREAAKLAADFYANYRSSASALNLDYLLDGWQLDDEEELTLHNSRKQIFNYMIRTVSAYGLEGDLALNEDQVDEFVSWRNNENVVRRIQFLETNQETYKAFGPYWLTLAESYSENGQYRECLSAADAYEALDIQIFRRDCDFARCIPLVLAAAERTMEEADYIPAADRYCRLILKNTDNDDWALRFFAARVYSDLYARTNDGAWLRRAYDITLNNVNQLVDTQREQNAAYLADVAEAGAVKGETALQKKERNQYNKSLREARKTELPPVYEPLLINCGLLKTLAESLSVPDDEKMKILSILHAGGESLFLVSPIDGEFWFGERTGAVDAKNIDVAFGGKEFRIPAEFVSDEAEITVRVSRQDRQDAVFDRWKLIRVERGKNGDLSSFIAVFRCGEAVYAGNEDVAISVRPGKTGGAQPLRFGFRSNKPKYFGIQVDFADDIWFRRTE